MARQGRGRIISGNLCTAGDVQCPKNIQNPSDISFQPGISSSCSFPLSIFLSVMLNLTKNPNITSSYLFRADIMYDSNSDASFAPLHDQAGWAAGEREICSLAKHMKTTYRPRPLTLSGWKMTRMIVREMIPRNPRLDKSLAQTCCFYERTYEHSSSYQADATGNDKEPSKPDPRETVTRSCLVIYVPHVEKQEDIPYYHPRVRAIAFLCDQELSAPLIGGSHSSTSSDAASSPAVSILAIHTAPFSPASASSPNDSDRLTRILRNLLTVISRHGHGRLAGYTKRVNHDTLIPQARFQNTYTRLKLTYAARLAQDWQEVTDPTKHVFEDLGIATFLIELWRDIYAIDPEAAPEQKMCQGHSAGFYSFVDVGCGNGVLVAILRWEGYDGWGFDIRQRKSWTALEKDKRISGRLCEAVLVPALFGGSTSHGTHDGVFDNGTFIISNHADELTPWTPLLARLSHSAPFLAIPCCSHDLGGARTRYGPQKPKEQRPRQKQSAYQTLCEYVERLSEEVGYETKKEYLRIPSTRNVAIIGMLKGGVHCKNRTGAVKSHSDGNGQDVEKEAGEGHADEEGIKVIVEREMRGLSIDSVGADWRKRAYQLKATKGDVGH